jgi:nicotinamide phosphoribosyltransferase
VRQNLILQTDSYKLTHWDMYPVGTRRVYSYLEARKGATHAKTMFFGLQYLLKEYLEGARVTREDITEAHNIAEFHFGRRDQFNFGGWDRIVRIHGGRIPIRIHAVPEGALVPVGNVLMTIENTDPQLPWLTNAVESLLMKVWYPTTVATQSYFLRNYLSKMCEICGGTPNDSLYMLHDFGYRGVSSEESAMLGGAAHLLNFKGTDTLPALRFLRHYYGASLDDLAHSVAASEHSIMTQDGPKGEHTIARRIIANHHNEIVSLVADSYDYYAFVKAMCDDADHVKRYQVNLVIRPDSVTKDHPTPASLVLWTLGCLAERLGVTETSTGHRLTRYKVLWGDGIDADGIKTITNAACAAGYAAQNLVFGMGGGLLQKVNRDTERFAIKCSAKEISTDANELQWVPVQKDPLDASKASKAGRLILNIHPNGELETLARDTGFGGPYDLMKKVFEDGIITRSYQWNHVHNR